MAIFKQSQPKTAYSLLSRFDNKRSTNPIKLK